LAADQAGSGLADTLVSQVTARLRQFIASFDGSPHVDELFSEHLLQARDLYQKYAARYGAQNVATIERVCRRQRLALAPGMTPRELSRCIEMAINGTKSAHPGMQPAAAFLGDLAIMLRTLIAGAVAAPKRQPKRPAAKKPVPKKTARKKPGGRP
jgi:TetR/AcrR family acrAB operon transcriptional repressor